MVPTLATFATALPDTMPKKAEPTTAILAAPPRNVPISAAARSEKKSEPPQRVSTCPMMMNGTTTTTAICERDAEERVGVDAEIDHETAHYQPAGSRTFRGR